MRTIPAALLILLALAAAGGGGYWLAGHRHGTAGDPGAGAPAVAQGSASTAAPAAPAARKVLYYRNPMGLADTSPTPKKDSMGMDYIAVYADDETAAADPGAAGQVRISTEKVQKLGVRTEVAALRSLGRSVRASGRVEADERRITMISPRFEGYVERLHVNATGQAVATGQPLFEVYSPELVSAQREYLIAVQGLQAMQGAGGDAVAGLKQLADASLARLRNWNLSAGEIDQLVRSGQVRQTVTLHSPVRGVVTDKKAFQGMRFMAGEALYQVTDLSSVWVLADVFEQEIGLVKTGTRATVRLDAYPGQAFEGRVTFVYPTLKPETRSVAVRIELANPRQLLKPAMFAQVELQAGGGAQVLAVPDSAVLDSGTRRIVLLQRGEGRFEPREVRLGTRGNDFVEVLEGVQAGDEVVVSANFLIDAESNLKAAVAGFGAPAAKAPAAAVAHQGTGSVDSIEAASGIVVLNHEAIASLRWPAMTMEFKVANPSLLAGLKPGARLAFEFVERQPGEWVITKAVPGAGKTAATGTTGR